MQILLSVHMTRFAYTQILRIRKMRFALGLRQVQIFQLLIHANFAYVSKCVHMARFAYVRKFGIYAKSAYVCKSGHVYTALVSANTPVQCFCNVSLVKPQMKHFKLLNFNALAIGT